MHYGLATEVSVFEGVPSPAGWGSYTRATPWANVPTVRGPTSNTVYLVEVKMPSYGDAAQFDLETHVKLVKLAEATDRWRRYVLDRDAPDDLDSLTETVEAVVDVVSGIGPQALSLQDLHPEVVHAEHLAAVLRSSSSWRHEVPGWDEALGVAIAAARQMNFDVHDVLFGLV